MIVIHSSFRDGKHERDMRGTSRTDTSKCWEALWKPGNQNSRVVVIPGEVNAKGQGYIENTVHGKIGCRSPRLPISEKQGAPGWITSQIRRQDWKYWLICKRTKRVNHEGKQSGRIYHPLISLQELNLHVYIKIQVSATIRKPKEQLIYNFM